MDTYYIVGLSILGGVWLLAAGFKLGYTFGQHDYEGWLVQKGYGEYYLNNRNKKCFRMKPRK